MMKIRIYLSTLLTVLAFASFQVTSAATITSSLGNTSPSYSDGDVPPGFALEQTGPAPYFDQVCGGGDAVGPNCSASWTHSFAAITDPILSASLTIGIVDHDSAASGSQLSAFSVGGSDLTMELDNLFEGSGGGDAMYNEYTLNLGAGLFGSLAGGSVMVNLALGGKGLDTCTLVFICPGAPVVSETDFNAANLIFSTLTIETRDVSVIPIPAAAPLFASALVLMGLYRRRIQRKDV